MRIHWLWFDTLPGLTDRMKSLLMKHFSDPEEIYHADGAAFSSVAGLSSAAYQALNNKSLERAETILETCRKKNLKILPFCDADYPTALKGIFDPPLVLYYKGRLPELDAYPRIGVVGTRKASDYGLTTAKRMGYQIAGCGGIVVSGMASGIDTMAMSGALAAGGITVGVLGCGADVVYPASNGGLYRDVEKYGCILSEFAPGTPPLRYNFPMRNRIISGLSNGVLVVEAPEKSGAMITARLATEQGRDVFAVPGNIDQPNCAGSNRLLREGAVAASTGWDVVGEYQYRYPTKVHQDITPAHTGADSEEVRNREKETVKGAQKPERPGKNPNLKKEFDKKVIDNRAAKPYSDVNKGLPRLDACEKAVLDTMKNGALLVDEIVAETGLDTKTVSSALTMLTIKGVVERLPGNRVKMKQ